MKLEFQKVKIFLCNPERISGRKNAHEAQTSLELAGTASICGVLGTRQKDRK